MEEIINKIVSNFEKTDNLLREIELEFQNILDALIQLEDIYVIKYSDNPHEKLLKLASRLKK